MILLSVVVLLAYQVWVLYLTFQYPMIGIRMNKETNGIWTVTQVGSHSLGNRLGVEVGDIVLAVNDAEPHDHWTVYRFWTVDQADTITILQGSAVTKIEFGEFTTFESYSLFAVFFGMFSLLIAYFIYRKVGYVPSSRYLAAVFLCAGLTFISMSASIRGDPLGKFMINTNMLLIPVIFYRFLVEFMREKVNIKLSTKVLKPMYIAVATLIGSLTVFFTDFQYTYPMYNFLISTVLFVIIVFVVSMCIMFIYLYRKYRHDNKQSITVIKTVFMSVVCALTPVVVFSFIPMLLFNHEWIDSLYMSWFIFIFPLSFVYLLVTRRLYDIDMITRRIIFCMAIAFVPCCFFAGAVKLLATEISTERLVLMFILLLSGNSLVLYSLENLTTQLEPVLFLRKHRLRQALKKISRNLAAISTIEEMKNIILADILETLQVSGGAIVFRYKDNTELITEGHIQQEKVLELVNSNDSTAGGTYTRFRISQQEEYTSYLIITEKKTGTLLGTEEIQWLNMIITYLSVSLENMQLIRKLDGKVQLLSALLPEEEEAENLVWFRKLMFELQEKERIRIAMDIHDTTMQDLFFLKRRLQMMQDDDMLTQKGKVFLVEVTTFIDLINDGLRRSCFESHPYLLRESGLVATLAHLFQIERVVSEFKIDLVTSAVSEIEKQNMEFKLHMFRIVQELLNNAKKYSHASMVKFSIVANKNSIDFEYEDDGIGFEPARPVVRAIGSSGMGIIQIKNRVLTLGGKYELIASPGQGVRFVAYFPVKKGQDRVNHTL